MVKKVLNTNFLQSKINLQNNFFKNPQESNLNQKLFVSQTDSISFSKKLENSDVLKQPQSFIEKSVEKYIESKNLVKDKINSVISFGQNSIDFVKRSSRISFKKAVRKLNKVQNSFKPSIAQELAQKPVSELEEILIASLDKLA